MSISEKKRGHINTFQAYEIAMFGRHLVGQKAEQRGKFSNSRSLQLHTKRVLFKFNMTWLIIMSVMKSSNNKSMLLLTYTQDFNHNCWLFELKPRV